MPLKILLGLSMVLTLASTATRASSAASGGTDPASVRSCYEYANVIHFEFDYKGAVEGNASSEAARLAHTVSQIKGLVTTNGQAGRFRSSTNLDRAIAFLHADKTVEVVFFVGSCAYQTFRTTAQRFFLLMGPQV